MNIPIIRIEVESMKSAMVHAFSDQIVEMDAMFQAAIEDATQPEKVQRILTEAANKFIRQAVEEETRSYLLCGEGRKLIKGKVEQLLSDSYSS